MVVFSSCFQITQCMSEKFLYALQSVIAHFLVLLCDYSGTTISSYYVKKEGDFYG
ncbi:hypothetical protein XIS1_1620022 [Xenorhabdus innexi]|uniref:Uncharacterized protein n=1 Tax=Xenorhabdus innexi TaxID=290109 RepID=A0A1N6MV09_9GAMM|nr:hypothetical protein XIS1_1620022 [Xenorhabdus innexi]